ncbi:GlxA family transcriptional regulator [Aquihabitans daechungensis]|uniref:GlxA family transcriptional regulator n=1 Tax=Aquihabitans daechungensis TaxID=1052257 RepID=UPI003B9E4166
MTAPRTIVLLAFDQLQLLDLAGPLEVFDNADHLAGGGAYRILVATPDGARVRTTSGIEIGGDLAVADVPAEIDTLVVVGGRGTRTLVSDEDFLDGVRTLAARARRITSVCSGSFLLAAAGLLDGYQATTHWGSCDLLRTGWPDVEVLPDQIYVQDRDRWTSAGITAGIDLALALVEADHGPELAHEVAAWLVVFARRPGGQAQFSAQLQAQAARTPAVAEVQRWLPDHLDEDLTVDRLAERAGMSPRTFARTFRSETGTTPAAHVEELRVESARRLLETTDLTVGAIARSVGLKHAETLHRAFVRRVGTTPDRYRQHFARTPA